MNQSCQWGRVFKVAANKMRYIYIIYIMLFEFCVYIYNTPTKKSQNYEEGGCNFEVCTFQCKWISP